MTEFRLQRAELAAPLATPGYLLHITSPKFVKYRALSLAVLLHVLPLAGIALLLRWQAVPPAPMPPTLELVIDKSAYVGSGPQSLTPTPAVTPKPAAPPVPKASLAPAAPAPPPPSPPQSAVKPNPVVAAVKPVAALPLPAPPSPAAPPTPKPVARIAPAHPRPTMPAPPRLLGDNQPVGHAEAFGRIIPARPDATINPKPAYPLEAREHGEQGRVLLSIHIAPSGRPAEVDIITSSGFQILDQAAQTAVQHWQFNPAEANGKPVASVLLFPIMFQLDQP